MSEQYHPISHEKADQRDKNHALQYNLTNSVKFPAPQILSGKAYRRLMDRIHGRVHKPLNILSSRVARHGHGTEGIYRGLDQYIGDGKQRSLNSGREADSRNSSKLFPVHLKPGEGKLKTPFAAHQTADNEPCGNALGNHGRKGDPGNPHMEPDHETEVQTDVYNTCYY